MRLRELAYPGGSRLRAWRGSSRREVRLPAALAISPLLDWSPRSAYPVFHLALSQRMLVESVAASVSSITHWNNKCQLDLV